MPITTINKWQQKQTTDPQQTTITTNNHSNITITTSTQHNNNNNVTKVFLAVNEKDVEGFLRKAGIENYIIIGEL